MINFSFIYPSVVKPRMGLAKNGSQNGQQRCMPRFKAIAYIVTRCMQLRGVWGSDQSSLMALHTETMDTVTTDIMTTDMETMEITTTEDTTTTATIILAL